ncbi:glutamate-5-semialdehyde dehydrogenase [Methylacidimicrobium cyclopophantes]|uniref:Gamma-glutamyl phosphate reductase n=1 Tax=Methylacidimicrobium cyclopophantes TaxID=1041766 RepID=A0A5E6MFT2_9BACT|nr:glutamate-5-semialdehyde dehydrogenase [Methylacidimicrobium cyclopophantes]VVM07961.1 glutamate-5-semialdehyde dehydrogenase [Methylacidimicrobium cyclopophantes]
MISLEEEIEALCREAKTASRELARLEPAKLDGALEAIGRTLEAARPRIEEANRIDLEAGRSRGLGAALLDRLHLSPKAFSSMLRGIEEVRSLPSPLGRILEERIRPNGLRIRKMRVPIGVIGVIYESRPNVTVDVAVLCLKAGNAVVLRGGSEAFHSNSALARALAEGLERAGLPSAAIQLLPTVDRASIPILCRQRRYLDLLIPRGGYGLIETVVSHAQVPVIKHFQGICHVFVEAHADLEMARRIVLNAKCQRPAVCNAMETLLVDRKIASQFLPGMVRELRGRGVEIRGDETTRLLGGAEVLPATTEDWATEYLDLILSVRVVDGLTEALSHIEQFGSSHSDAIVTEDRAIAEEFLRSVDSAVVYWNSSTRFTDGGEFGLGAEVGISTDKIHARGPMGVEELTSYKYVVIGSGQTRE